jgi:hypothetical protein
MKKVLSVVLLSIFAFAAFSISSVKAADDLIDLYPWGEKGTLDGSEAYTQTLVGDSNWDFVYGGYRYNIVKDSARYAAEFEDADNSGTISALEMTGMSWNAFASLIINDTDDIVVLETANARTDLTQVVHRIYTYFDADGVLQMFEDHINQYYIHNDGTNEAPDWRLATEAEQTAFDAAEDAAVDTPMTRYTHIRMALDENDADGYVLEPIGYLKWVNADVDTATADMEDWSTIVSGNPDYVTINSGWTVLSFGTLDRGSANPLTTAYIKMFPEFMLDDSIDPAEVIYTDQPASFDGLTALDNDVVSDGINIVVDFNSDFEIPNTVSASWLDMFDEDGKIINTVEKVDFSLTISQDDVDLQTIDYVYDELTDAYTASEAITVIDSSEFGSGYKAVWMATTPEGDQATVEADIVIGVMPPTFAGVEDRYSDQGVYIDLLEGITADDGYGNSKTSDIVVSYPADFNPYNPFPGTYQIDLEFNHHVHFEGEDPTITIKGVDFAFDPDTKYNADIAVNSLSASGAYGIWDEIDNFTESASGWGSVMVVVAADGTMKERYDRYTWEYTDSTGTIVGDAVTFAAWQAALTLEEGEFVIATHGSNNAPNLRSSNLSFGDPVSFVVGSPDEDFDILTETSYELVIDDMTAPTLIVLDDDYAIEGDDFDSVNEAILANVVAYDFTDAVDDLAIYVSSNGGLDLDTPAEYTVEVTVEDVAGHTDVRQFVVTVKAVKPSSEDVESLIDESKVTDAEIQALIDAAIDELPEDEKGATVIVTIVVAVVAAGLSLADQSYFLRKNKQ